jgi:hypothetical protein
MLDSLLCIFRETGFVTVETATVINKYHDRRGVKKRKGRI